MTRRQNDDAGSVMLIALVIVTIVGLLLTVIISFANTGVHAASQFADERRVGYEADGAVKGAINLVRGRSSAGRAGGSCPTYTPAAGASGVTMLVECVGLPGSGGSFDDQPPFALLMTGTASGEGITETGNSTLTVDGGVYTRGDLALDKPGSGANTRLTVYGDTTAQGNCTRTPVATYITTPGGQLTCNAPDDGAWNLNYAPAVATPPSVVDPTSTCPVGVPYVSFTPGTYTEVPVAACNRSIWWFQPGAYYFDFPAAADNWDLSKAKATVIGGTPSGTWSSPGGCAQDNAATTYPGVQFIFGGTSRITNASQGSLELCATNTSATNKQKIALFGLSSGSLPDATLATLRDPTPALSGFASNPTDASTIADSKEVSETFSKLDSGNVAYTFPSTVPVGSRITSAVLRIAHHEVDTAKNLSLQVSASTGDSTTLTACSASCVGTLNITVPTSYGYVPLRALTATFTASSGKPKKDDPDATSYLDGVELDVTYTAPAFEAVCSTCTLLTSTVDQNLFLHGTVYAPTGGFSLRVHNLDTTIFQRGLIGRTLTVNVSSSSKQTEAPFELPKANPGARKVLFAAYRVDGTIRTLLLRAAVQYTDYRTVSGGSLAFPGYTATTTAWDVLRPD